MNYKATETEAQQVSKKSLLIQNLEGNLEPLNKSELQRVVGGHPVTTVCLQPEPEPGVLEPMTDIVGRTL